MCRNIARSETLGAVIVYKTVFFEGFEALFDIGHFSNDISQYDSKPVSLLSFIHKKKRHRELKLKVNLKMTQFQRSIRK